MTLAEILAGVETRRVSGDTAREIAAVACDSRRVAPGAVFFALRGEKTDGNRHVSDAVGRGATAIVSELPSGKNDAAGERIAATTVPPSVAWVEVANARRALATAAANFYGHPADALKLVGVTGTNGKTTTTYLLDSILRAAGLSTGLLGTIAYRTPRSTTPAANTTPESLDLQAALAEVRDAGGTHATLEVSSHALAMDRVWACPFRVAVFTNLTRDHLDYHKSMENYFAAKRRLFEGTGRGAPACGVVNLDDPGAPQLAGLAQETLTYGLRSDAEITTPKFDLKFTGLEFAARTPAGPLELRSPLVGRINVYNILAAVAAAVALGIPREAIEAGIRELKVVPGRFERVDLGQPFLVVVDYAHTDDALRNLMQTARELNPTGRLITLFGCGGDRDRTKRPLMGELAGRLSDHVVLTSDNPRSEDPLDIINDVLVGLQKARGNYEVEADRGRAISLALDRARAGDIVLLAGKGHETYQVLRDRTIDFDDRAVAADALRARGFGRRR